MYLDGFLQLREDLALLQQLSDEGLGGGNDVVVKHHLISHLHCRLQRCEVALRHRALL